MVTRLLEIVILLSKDNTLTASQIASKFGVSSRTIYRDIERLSEAGIPIVSERGKSGGVKLVGNIFSSKSREELTESFNKIFGKHSSDKAVIRDIVDALERSDRSWFAADLGSEAMNTVFGELKKAVSSRELVRLRFRKKVSDELICIVEPMQLYYSGGVWYLRAFCHRTGMLIAVKIGDIYEYSLIGEHFIPREIDLDSAEFV